MDKNDVRVAAMHALMVPEHEMVDSVARAILAERKRCAEVCRDATNSTIGEAYAKAIMEPRA